MRVSYGRVAGLSTRTRSACFITSEPRPCRSRLSNNRSTAPVNLEARRPAVAEDLVAGDADIVRPASPLRAYPEAFSERRPAGTVLSVNSCRYSLGDILRL